jgi:LPS sulfotransferase NodH
MPATVSGDFTPSYFNAGFIAVQSEIGFGNTWLDCCRLIDADIEILNKRPWLDQIALSVAVQKLGLSYDCLDESYNYPAHLKPLNARRLPCFCHYHFPEVIRREPLLNALIKEIAEQYPTIEQIIASHPKWSTLLENYRGITKPPLWRRLFSPKKINPSPPPDLIITGIPRSGTSYLCNLLHRVENCIVINEPPEIFEPLINQSVPWGIATFYKDIRRDILDGKPIKNKLQNGRLIEDTMLKDKITSYMPKVTASEFILGTKNTLSYLSRIDAIQRAMPYARIVACVRNPIDTIASWKTSFPHLKNADINSFPVGHPDDPWLCGWQQKALKYIAGIEDAAERRAVLWRYLAELILAQARNLILVRYEELTANPVAVIERIFQGWDTDGPHRSKEAIAPSQPRRRKRAMLDKKDIQAIRAICTQSAAELEVRI